VTERQNWKEMTKTLSGHENRKVLNGATYKFRTYAVTSPDQGIRCTDTDLVMLNSYLIRVI